MGDDRGPSASARSARVNGLLFVVVVLLVPLGYAFVPAIFNDGDTSWHIAVGQWIAQHGRIPTADPFSFTAYGKPWVAMEWPADLLFASAYGAAGYAGLAAVFAAALMALHAVVFVHLQRRASPIAFTPPRAFIASARSCARRSDTMIAVATRSCTSITARRP